MGCHSSKDDVEEDEVNQEESSPRSTPVKPKNSGMRPVDAPLQNGMYNGNYDNNILNYRNMGNVQVGNQYVAPVRHNFDNAQYARRMSGNLDQTTPPAVNPVPPSYRPNGNRTSRSIPRKPKRGNSQGIYFNLQKPNGNRNHVAETLESYTYDVSNIIIDGDDNSQGSNVSYSSFDYASLAMPTGENSEEAATTPSGRVRRVSFVGK
ncbi:hypothetical protein ADEAN_000104400 [Angomonas deanei]|uniref:Uncharacterized protein n=1 Tax=Angomonas deanei TaxID=59799 RepID=A0A7G2C389_9TRYP|nr:hypothetical protein ADEAN_000104400 [Angomonas deanei]